MVKRLDARGTDISAALEALLDSRAQRHESVAGVVADIIARVRREGDAALRHYTQQFDSLALSENALRISEEDIAKAHDECPPEVAAALALAARRLRDYHARQMPEDLLYTDDAGTQLGWRWSPLEAAGLYVPGGRASYPSSVLHNAIPAQVAGCKRLVMVVPTPHGTINPAILVAAQLAGISEIYRIGGAQAVAALAYGTESIVRVDKIVGPGNAYVAEAKRQVFGAVGIDSIAGPSEILVVADAKNESAWIAADLLSQAEHDPEAQAILITDDAAFADRVEMAVEHTLQSLDRVEIARASWRNNGVIILCDDAAHCEALINQIAPEHLELAIDAPEALAAKVRHAGAIFLGRHTPEAIGDYLAGPSHVLPTTRAARYASGLSVYDFIKKISLIGCTERSLQSIAEQAISLAKSEGLGAHALSLKLRQRD